MLVAYLQDTSLSVVVGKSGIPAAVDGCYRLDGLRGIIRDGVIIDPEAFRSLVEPFWKEHQLETKRVKVVVETKRIAVHTTEAPVFKKERDLRAYMQREVQTQSRFSDPCYEYRTISTDAATNTARMLITTADKSLVERIVGTFKQIGVEISAIATPYTSVISFTERMRGDRTDDTVLFLTSDHDHSVAVLFKAGLYRYSSEQHLFTDYGTPDFGGELLRSITGIEQFIQADHISERFDLICLLGLTGPASDVVEAAIRSYDQTLRIAEVREDEVFAAAQPLASDDVVDILPAILGLGAFDNGTALVDSYKTITGTGMTTSDKGDLIGALKVPVICALACIAIMAGLLAWNATTGGQADSIRNSLMTPDALKQISAYNTAKSDNDLAAATQDSAARLADVQQSYPVPGSQLEAAIDECASGLVTWTPYGYSETTGQYVIQATAANNDNISTFVERLGAKASESKTFTVANSGYAYQETTTSTPGRTQDDWTLYVTLSLEEGEGR